MPKQFRTPRIVHAESRPVWPWVLGVVAAAGIAWVAYQQGQQHAGYFSDASDEEIETLQAEVEALREERDRQRELAARYQRAAQIDRAAADEVRKSLREAQEEQAKLRQQVAFLNSLILGKVTALEISEVKLTRVDDSNEYTFSFLVSKRDKGGERVSGRLELRLSGLLGGKAVVLDEKKLDIAHGLRMGFKHFQRFEGKLKLPVGFIPKELVIKGYPDGKKFKPFEKNIEWQV